MPTPEAIAIRCEFDVRRLKQSDIAW